VNLVSNVAFKYEEQHVEREELPSIRFATFKLLFKINGLTECTSFQILLMTGRILKVLPFIRHKLNTTPLLLTTFSFWENSFPNMS
jgi:hypothetical protein